MYWLNYREQEQQFKEFQFLKKYDSDLHIWNDLIVLKFKLKVILKYTRNEYCDLDISDFNNCTLAFKNNITGETELCVCFWIEYGIIGMPAHQFIEIPPKERKHWKKFQVKTRDEYPGIWKI